MPLLRGTHADSWLAAQLARNIEAEEGARVWLFQPARQWTAADGSGHEVRAWQALPAAAADCVRQLCRD